MVLLPVFSENLWDYFHVKKRW